MAGRNIIVITFTLVAFLVLSYQATPEDVNSDKSSSTTAVGNRTCVNLLSNGTLDPAPNCTNGRHLVGCCVDRSYCDYGTPAVDRTLYGPVGYKSSCDTMHICCPLQYVLPYADAEPDNNASMDFNDDDQTIDDDLDL